MLKPRISALIKGEMGNEVKENPKNHWKDLEIPHNLMRSICSGGHWMASMASECNFFGDTFTLRTDLGDR